MSTSTPKQGGDGRVPTAPLAKPPTLPKPPAVPKPPAAPPPPEPPSGVSATIPAPALDASPPASGAVVQIVATDTTPRPKRCSVCGERYPVDFLVCPRDATPLVSDQASGEEDPLVGRVLGETYRIARVLGEGGMARVYEARHVRLPERRLAVKILHAEFARDADSVVRFQREAESSSAIAHPNVIDVFDVHKTPDGRPYLVSEFLEGEELGSQLDNAGRLDVATSVSITRQICHALEAAHARGVVHRDMKPENVFLTARDGRIHVKVLDFGISKAASRDTHLTRTGLIMGTPSYMAPEQARGEKVDHRADIYATGAILYACLTGKRPFESDDPTHTLGMVLTSEPTRPRAIDPSIPEGLELIVQRAMAKDPRDRYESMRELDAALAPYEQPDAAPSEAMIAVLHKAQGAAPASVSRTIQRTPPGLMSSADGEARRAELARPEIVVYSLAIALWFLGGFVDALGGMVRVLRQGELLFSESLLLLLGTIFLALTPAVLFVLHVRKVAWPNSVRAVELASDLRRLALSALVAYGVAGTLFRVFCTVVLRRSTALSGGGTDILLFVVSLVGAVAGGGIGPVARVLRRNARG